MTPTPLPSKDNDELPRPQPVAVLDWKPPADGKGTQVLIQWAGLYLEDASWELKEDLLSVYLELLNACPELHLEDKVFVDGEKGCYGPR